MNLDALPEGECRPLIDAALDYDDEIRRSGHYIGSDALQPLATARTVRVRGGKVSTTDGPFAETKEQLGGFYLIEAKDLNEAISRRADSRGAHRQHRGPADPGADARLIDAQP